MIPRPLSPSTDIPLFVGFEPNHVSDGRYPQWPFAHSIQAIAEVTGFDTDEAAAALWQRYRSMMAAFDLIVPGDDNAAGPYNLLMTREWMWLVPRRRESVEGISLNALAYAGALLVKRRQGIAEVERLGPMHLLSCCAGWSGG